jgi:hypothetical protein
VGGPQRGAGRLPRRRLRWRALLLLGLRIAGSARAALLRALAEVAGQVRGGGALWRRPRPRFELQLKWETAEGHS